MAMYQNELASAAAIEAVAKINAKSIRQALKDYVKHTDDHGVIDDISDAFVERLAQDSAVAKTRLRNLFRRVKGWDEDLQAFAINGTTTHEPDYNHAYSLGLRIIDSKLSDSKLNSEDRVKLYHAVYACTHPAKDDPTFAEYLSDLAELAPKAYCKGKKLSRVFRDFAKAIGVYNESSGSDYQHIYTLLADELNARKLDFKLFVSINPAHFLTMSNPMWDERGTTMKSCHSLNNSGLYGEYYSSGCAGYARDEVSFITFVASDPNNPEKLNNRKITRHVFFYLDGVLLQSRLYRAGSTDGDSYGGVLTAHPISAEIRDLVERAISESEGVANGWRCAGYPDNPYGVCIDKADGFGGYPDWLEFGGELIKIAVQKARLESGDYPRHFTAGAPGLCVQCGEEVYGREFSCEYCNEDYETCAECGRRERAEDGYWVINRYGESVWVCSACCDDYYAYVESRGEYYYYLDCVQCSECGEWFLQEDCTAISNGEMVCDGCLEDNYCQCEECGEWVHNEDAVWGWHDGYEVGLCESCRDYYYHYCESCDQWHHEDDFNEESGTCPNCHRAHEA